MNETEKHFPLELGNFMVISGNVFGGIRELGEE